MLVKCTPSASCRGFNCLPNKQPTNFRTTRLRLLQPTLFDWMKHLLFGKISIALLFFFAFTIQQSWGQCTSSDFPTALCYGNPTSPAFSLALDETGTASIAVSDINNGSFDSNCGVFSLALSQSIFNCSDIGNVPITLIVANNYTDVMGNHPNQNICNTSITIMDNLLPVITCPATDVVTCPATIVPSNAGATTDVATATDNCGLAIAPISPNPNALPMGFSGAINSFYYYSDNSTPSLVEGQCNTIQRTWRVYDENENFSECTQMISIIDNQDPIFDFNASTPIINPVPSNTTVSCGNIPTPPTINIPGAQLTATDNCPAPNTNLFIDFDETFSLLTADANQNACYTITRTWTATDGCGREISASQIITVTDTNSPVLSNVPDLTYNTITGGCTATISYDYLNLGTVTDACFMPLVSNNPNAPSPALTYAYEIKDSNGDNISGGVGLGLSFTNMMLPVGNFTFNFYAFDPCGNVGQETINVTVNDNEDPTVICTSTIDVEINADTNIENLVYNTTNPFVSISDNCTDEANIVLSFECTRPMMAAASCTTIGCADVGTTVTIEVIATDESNRNASCFIDITVLDGAPQCVTNPITVILDNFGNYTLTGMVPNPAMGTDLDNIDGSFDDCGGMTEIVSISQTMFTCADAAISNGEVMVTLTVQDNAMPPNESSCMGIVTVKDGTAPTCSAQNISVALDTDGEAMIMGTSFGMPTTVTQTYSFTGGVQNFTVPNGVTSIDVEVTGASGGDGDGVTGGLGATTTATLAVAPGDVLNFFVGQAGISLVGNGMPNIFPGGFNGGGTADATTNGFIVGSGGGASDIRLNGILEADRIVVAGGGGGGCDVNAGTDGGGANGASESTGNGGDAAGADMAGGGGGQAGGAAGCGANGGSGFGGVFGLAAAPGDGMVVITYQSPAFADNCGVMSVTVMPNKFGCTDIANNPNEVTLTVTDNSNNVTTCTADVTVMDNLAPMAKCKDITVPLDEQGDVTIIPAIINNNSTDNCTITSLSLDITDFDCSDIATNPNMVTLTVSDGTNSAMCTASVTVQDDIAPNLNCPSTVQIPLNQNGNGVLNPFTANAFDNCVGLIQPTYSQTAFTCTDVTPSPFAVTATATDGTNSISCSFMVTVVDNIAPILTCPPNQTIDCVAAKNTFGVVPAATATDNCPNPTVSFVSDVQISKGGFCRRYRRTFSAVDASNNAATNCNFIINVLDNTVPTLDNDPLAPTPGPVLQQISCDNLPANNQMVPTFVDNDGDAICEVAVAAVFVSATNSPGCPYTRTRRYRATDACGNPFFYNQVFQVIDNKDPEFDANVVNTLVVDTDNGQCFASNVTGLNFTNLASDNCTSFGNLTKGFTVTEIGASMAIHFSTTSLDASNFSYPVGIYTAVFTVADACGNDDVHTVSFTVEDNNIPVADCKAFKNITLDNNGQAALSPGDFDDGGTYDPCGFTLSLSPASLSCSDIDGANLPTPVTVTLIATDPSGNMNTCNTTVNLSLPATTVNCPNGLTVNCAIEDYTDLAITGMPIIDTPCSNFTTSFIPIVDDEVKLSGSNAFCWEVTRTFNISVTDPNGNAVFTSTCEQIINLIDNEDPTFDSMPLGTTIACVNDLPDAENITASDANSCLGMGVGVSHIDAVNGCTSVVRTYTAEDECGNTETFSQTFAFNNDNPIINFGNDSPFDFANDAGDCGAIINIDFSQYITDCSDFDDLVITISDQNSAAIYIENDVDILGNPITSNDFNGGFFAVGDYDFDISVTDPCGGMDMETFSMYIQDEQAPSLNCDPTEIVDIDQTGVLNLSDVFDSATDNCGMVTTIAFDTNNDGQVAVDGQSITFTQADAGNTYNVVINAADDAIDQATGGTDANSNACDILVTIVGNQITLLAAGNNSPITASPSATPQMVEVPVTVENFDFIEGFSFTYNLTNPLTGNIAEFVGITDINSTLANNGNLNTTVIGAAMNQISVTYAVTSGSGTVSLGTATLFKAIVLVDDAAAVGDIIDLDIDGSFTPLEISQNTSGVSITINNPTLVDGQIEITAPVMMINVAGNVSNDQSIGIEGVELQITNTNSSMTDMNGDYSQQVVQGTAITVDPEYNPPVNIFTRVNLFDANAIQSHAGGSPLLTDLPDWIAADVNNSGTITISDVVQIVKLNLGITSEYPNNVDSWEFIPTSDVLTQPTQHFVVPTHTDTRSFSSAQMQNDVTLADFLALEMGNVTPSGDQALSIMMNNPSAAVTAAVRNNKILTLTARDQAVKKGQIVPIEFRADNFQDLIGFVLDVNFNPSLLKFVEVLDGDLSDWNAENYSIEEVESGRLPIAWLAKNATSLSKEEIVFTLLFEAQTDLTSLENTLQLSYENMPTYAGTINKEVLPVELNFENGLNNDLEDSFSLSQNRPNPFKSATTIGFELPKATTATLRITDISGKTIQLFEGDYEAGYHEVEVKNLDATGVLFYELKTPDYQLTKRMILLD